MPQLRLDRPKAIVFDVTGTASNTTFVNRILIGYIKKSVDNFVENNWGHEQVQRDISMLRKASKSNSGWPQIPDSNDDPAAVQKAVSNLANYLLDNKLDCLAFAQLRFHMWFDGYEKGLLLTPVYADVAIQMKKWRCDYHIRLYVLSQGWAEANQVFMSRTNNGDMSLLIDGFFDSDLGSLTSESTYKNLLGKISTSGKETLFLTKSNKAAHCAKSAGLLPVLVLTHGWMFDALTDEEKQTLKVIRTMNEIEFE